MYKTWMVFAAFVVFFGCHSAREKTNEALKKTGETVAEGTSEFVKGVKQGIGKAFDSQIQLSGDLKDGGLAVGKAVTADSLGRENVLSVYMIFNKDFNELIMVKVLDKNGQEYGRVKRDVAGKSGDAGYVDFYFPGRTDFESKSTFVFERIKK